jgi:hypothetical protein
MKIRIALVIVVLFINSPSFVIVRGWNNYFREAHESAAVSVRQTAVADLVVKEIVFEQSPSQIRVRVLNAGNGASSSCYLALQSLVSDDPALGTKQRVWTIEIPALEAGKGYSNVIDISPLSQANGPWKATVDRSNTVRESNEANNSLTYPVRNPGPLPPRRRLADLVIESQSLVDPYGGDVSVQVWNKGGADAAPCDLRLIVWEAGKFEQKFVTNVFLKVPAIGARQKKEVHIKAGVPIISTRYSLYIDIGNDVTESNENNNRAEGEAGKY